MSDEEKEAIEFVKSELQDEKIARNDYQSLTGLYGNLEIETILNLIEKQSKELKEIYQTGYVNGCVSKVYEINKKWKDKIKAKIEIRKEEKENCKDSIEEKYLLREIYALRSLLEKE